MAKKLLLMLFGMLGLACQNREPCRERLDLRRNGNLRSIPAGISQPRMRTIPTGAN